MAELDQHRPTTSAFHRLTMEESVAKLKRLQRFTRQFSIFVHCEEEKVTEIPSPTETTSAGVAKQNENTEDHLFKYPGNVRAIKRKRNLSNQPVKNAAAKRKMMEHQKSIREDSERSSTETEIEEKMDPKEEKEVQKETSDVGTEK